MKTVNTPYYCRAMTLVETLIAVSVFATLMAIGMNASLNSEASQRENYKNERSMK
jgi:prepilin-type N-terminal cleavage/methylation domain-containing protein